MMEKYAVIRRVAAFRINPLITLALALTIMSLACMPPQAQAGSKERFWRHRDQYVRLEPQDRGKQPPAPNAHPVNLEPARIREMLGSLEIRYPKRDKAETLFTSGELDVLQNTVSEALAAATPEQDVTFAIVGIHRGLFAFNHDRSVTTGRLFYVDGRLNLIIGRLHEEYNEDEDRRMHPFLPGSRKYKAPRSWDPAKPWEVVPMGGVAIKRQGDIERYNWLMLNPDPKLWKAVRAEKKAAKETAKAAFQEASQVRQESAQVSAEQERLRAEMEALKKQVQTLRQTPAATPTAAPAPPAATDDVENRLRRLQSLHDKGLITDREYRAKRQEIIDSL